MEDHIHQWKPFLQDAPGAFDKPCRGRVLACEDQPCGTYLFIPHAKPTIAIESVLVAA